MEVLQQLCVGFTLISEADHSGFATHVANKQGAWMHETFGGVIQRHSSASAHSLLQT